MTMQDAAAGWRAVVGAVLFCVAGGSSGAGSLPPGPEVFGAAPAVESVALNPSGTWVAWADVRKEEQYAVAVEVATGAMRRSPVHPDMKLRGVLWADDDTLLLRTSMARPGPGDRTTLYEFHRIVAVDITTTGQNRVLLMDDDARAWVTGATIVSSRTAQPGTVIMSSWDYSKASQWTHDLFSVDVRTGRGRKLASGTEYTREWVVDAAGTPVARADWDRARSDFTVLARRPNGAWKEIYRLGNGSTLTLVGITRDGKGLAALGSAGGALSKLWGLALDGSGVSVLADDPTRDVEGVLYDPYTNHPIGAWLGGLDPELRWFDTEAESRFSKVARAFPGRTVQLFGRSANGERVLAKVSDPSTPAVYYLVDFKTRRADIVGEAFPALVEQPLGRLAPIDYPARDGTRIPAYLTLPPGGREKGLPLVVLPHDGPAARDEFEFDWFAQFLATRGYAVLQPQFRGSTGFGEPFRNAGHGEWGGVMQDDVTDGVRAMIDRGIADPRRICIVGAGYGGYAALAGVTLTPDLYTCAVSVNGISDLPSAVAGHKPPAGAESSRYDFWRKSIGAAQDPKLAQKSPARLAAQVKVPVLLMHGVDNTVVSVSQSRAMAKALDAAGKVHRLVELTGEDHWLSRTATRIRVLEETERFLAAYLAEPDQAAEGTASP